MMSKLVRSLAALNVLEILIGPVNTVTGFVPTFAAKVELKLNGTATVVDILIWMLWIVVEKAVRRLNPDGNKS